MTTSIFQNPGLIDMTAVTTLGASVKEGDSPIGYFGTGLKFAIATILRNGSTITIWRNTEPYRFTTRTVGVRGQEFDQVCMNGTPLGFTTQLGRNWEPWMAWRELASNCRDESGAYWQSQQEHPQGWYSAEDQTTIVVEGDVFNEVWPKTGEIILASKPITVSAGVELHPGTSKYVYYRGVRVHELQHPSLFTYNLLCKIQLTEDRTAASSYEVEIEIEKCLGSLEDSSLLRRLLTCGDTFYEHHLNVPQYGKPKAAFTEMALELVMGATQEHAISGKIRQWVIQMTLDGLEVGHQIELTPVQMHMFQRACSLLGAAGFDMSQFPITTCDTLGPGIHGLARNGRIYLSRLAFQKGTRELAATLLEEYGHLKSGQADCTRGFQNWLFDQVLCLTEEVNGEPF